MPSNFQVPPLLSIRTIRSIWKNRRPRKAEAANTCPPPAARTVAEAMTMMTSMTQKGDRRKRRRPIVPWYRERQPTDQMRAHNSIANQTTMKTSNRMRMADARSSYSSIVANTERTRHPNTMRNRATWYDTAWHPRGRSRKLYTRFWILRHFASRRWNAALIGRPSNDVRDTSLEGRGVQPNALVPPDRWNGPVDLEGVNLSPASNCLSSHRSPSHLTQFNVYTFSSPYYALDTLSRSIITTCVTFAPWFDLMIILMLRMFIWTNLSCLHVDSWFFSTWWHVTEHSAHHWGNLDYCQVLRGRQRARERWDTKKERVRVAQRQRQMQGDREKECVWKMSEHKCPCECDSSERVHETHEKIQLELKKISILTRQSGLKWRHSL